MSSYDDMLNVQADSLKDSKTLFAEESRENRNKCYEMAERTTLAVAENADVFAVRIGNRLYAHKDKLDEWLLNQIGC